MKDLSYRLFFRAFSNKTRFDILSFLKKNPMNVTELCSKSGFEQSRISHNLKCLENCGFVNSSWNGKNKTYELDKKHILPILKEINKHIKTYNKRLESCGVFR